MGLTDYPVVVVSYDNRWPARFESERLLLEPALESWLEGGIHHVGSTAIPGLAAKPVIDIMAGVRNLEQSRAAFEILAELEYLSAPYRNDVMHWFCKPSPEVRTHHLHLVPFGSPLWRGRLAFRDWLRTHPETARDYETLKLRLAGEHEHDREAYTVGKAVFVESVTERALRDY